jgi:hypothetical protein
MILWSDIVRVRKTLFGAILLMLAALLAAQPARAIEAVDIAITTPNIDIASFLAFLETAERTVTIERPDKTVGTKEFHTLQGIGPGPKFYWSYVGFKNSATGPRTVTIVIPGSSFVGSGILWPKVAGNTISSASNVGQIAVTAESALDGSAYTFTLAPGQTGAVALETLRPGIANIKLWRHDAFRGQQDYFAFFRGALLGITLLLTLALFALYGFRSRAVFLAAGGFSLASVAFIALESGHLESLFGAFAGLPFGLPEVRAVIEGFMASLLLMFLGTHAEMRRFSPFAANAVLLLGGLALGIPVYGFVEPAIAAAAARGLFALTAIAGFLVLLLLWRRGEMNTEPALVTWAAILLWAFIAAVAMLDNARTSKLGPMLLAGLGTVLVIMTFTLAHFAFSQGYLSRTFFREAGRRALALAGARAYVWDWQSEDGDLFIGDELENALSPRAPCPRVVMKPSWTSCTPPTATPISPPSKPPKARAEALSSANSACVTPMAAGAGSCSGPEPWRGRAPAPSAASEPSPM